jgi:hypothetical protein
MLLYCPLFLRIISVIHRMVIKLNIAVLLFPPNYYSVSCNKKAYTNNVILNKLLKNKFRANKLVKYPLKDGSLLQLQLTLFKEFVLSLPKIILV